MPFPKILHCLVCDGTREEKYKLWTLLGFYGAAPDVEILIKDFRVPVHELAFLLIGDKGGEGHFKVATQISDEEGKIIVRNPELDVELRDPTKRWNLALNIVGGPRFSHPGKYIFTFLVDGKMHYETSFEVRQGKPEDFE